MNSKYLLGLMLMIMGGIAIWGNSVQSKVKDFKFNGIVQAVKYADNKSTPTVTVNNTEYVLSANIDFNRQIEKGDSIVKKKGLMTFFLFKKGTNKKVIFSD